MREKAFRTKAVTNKFFFIMGPVQVPQNCWRDWVNNLVRSDRGKVNTRIYGLCTIRQMESTRMIESQVVSTFDTTV